MAYLVVTTKAGGSKLWDPYDILGISSVWTQFERYLNLNRANNSQIGLDRESYKEALPEISNAIPS